jgi:hypothetical protein
MLCSLIVSKTVHANQLELSVMVGQMFGSDLVASDNSDISTDSGSNIAIGIAWEENVNGQGQVLLNRVSHDFVGENAENNSLDITYAHFNGVALFRQQNYVTTLSLGFGGAYFDADQGGDEVYPSASVAFGTRYEFSKQVHMQHSLMKMMLCFVNKSFVVRTSKIHYGLIARLRLVLPTSFKL